MRRKSPMPAVYRVPIRYLVCSASEILFWDAIFFLFETQGWGHRNGERRIELSNRRLVKLTGLKRRTVISLRAKLFEQQAPFSFLEEESSEAWHHVLVLPDYANAMRRYVIQKPTGLMTQKWLSHIYEETDSRLPLAIINRLLQQPVGRRKLSAQELRQRCKRPDRKTLPELGDFNTALSDLMRMGIIKHIECDHIILFCDLFKKPISILINKELGEQQKPPLLIEAENNTPQLAKWVQEIADIAGLDLHGDAAALLRDLSYIENEAEYKLLLQAVNRYKNSFLPGPKRWRQLWRSFCKLREQKTYHLTSQKVLFSLYEEDVNHPKALTLPLRRCLNLRYAKTVVQVNDPDFMLRHHHAINVHLYQGEELIWGGVFSAEDQTKRRDLTNRVRAKQNADFTVKVSANQTLPRVQLTVQLKALCL